MVNAPNLGDDIQAIKAGILEIADILVVNKADLPLAGRTADQLRSMLKLRAENRDVPVIETIATTGAGVEQLVDAVDFAKAADGQKSDPANFDASGGSLPKPRRERCAKAYWSYQASRLRTYSCGLAREASALRKRPIGRSVASRRLRPQNEVLAKPLVFERPERGRRRIVAIASGPDFCLISAPCGYDDPEILPA